MMQYCLRYWTLLNFQYSYRFSSGKLPFWENNLHKLFSTQRYTHYAYNAFNSVYEWNMYFNWYFSPWYELTWNLCLLSCENRRSSKFIRFYKYIRLENQLYTRVELEKQTYPPPCHSVQCSLWWIHRHEGVDSLSYKGRRHFQVFGSNANLKEIELISNLIPLN